MRLAAVTGAALTVGALITASAARGDHLHGRGSIRHSRDYQRYDYHIEYEDRNAIRLQREAIAAEEEARREEQRRIRRNEVEEAGRMAEEEYLESQRDIRASSREAVQAPRGLFYRRPGMSTSSLPEGHDVLSVEGAEYYHYSGIFYRRAPQGFWVVTAPVGAVVTGLPEGHLSVGSEGEDLFYYFGTFFSPVDGGYAVVSPPEGVFVPYLPDGYASLDVDGSRYYVFGDVRYQPVYRQGILVYTVVGG